MWKEATCISSQRIPTVLQVMRSAYLVFHIAATVHAATELSLLTRLLFASRICLCSKAHQCKIDDTEMLCTSTDIHSRKCSSRGFLLFLDTLVTLDTHLPTESQLVFTVFIVSLVSLSHHVLLAGPAVSDSPRQAWAP